jgi:hypothetical protein
MERGVAWLGENIHIIYLQSALCFGKTAFCWIWPLLKKLYANISTKFFTSDFNSLHPFTYFLDSSKSKRKYKFFQLLDFDKKLKKIAVSHLCYVSHVRILKPVEAYAVWATIAVGDTVSLRRRWMHGSLCCRRFRLASSHRRPRGLSRRTQGTGSTEGSPPPSSTHRMHASRVTQFEFEVKSDFVDK